MRFVGAIWKLLVGIKDALVLVFMLIFFSLLYMGLKSSPNRVGEGVLVMDLRGTITEQPSAPSTSELLAGTQRLQEYSRGELVEALDNAKDDDRVKAVALDLDGFLGGGQVAISDVGAAIDRVRKSGKKVVAYAAGYSDDGYQLASHASEIWLHPLGAVAVAGPGGQHLYYKGLMDKLGITANVYRVGTYKAAVEPYTRSDMSPEARENNQALAGALLETWREDVLKARPAAGIDTYLKDPGAVLDSAGGDLGKAALAAKLVDKLGERRSFEARLAELGGRDDRKVGGFKSIGLDDYIGDVVESNPKGPIGVVTVAGEIVDGKAKLGTAGGDSIASAIEKGLREDNLKALVVRVDSPGGSVLASERIRQALLGAKARKIPVVVSMGSVAASGGYWVSTAGDYVYAEPSTITGSIGVFGILPSFQGTLAKLGLGADGVKTTPLSGEPDVFHGPSPEAGKLIQAGVDGVYRNFLGIVAEARHKSPADIDRIAQGRVWDGGSARQLGLVDGFGGMDEAIAKAAELAHLGKERGVRYLERPKSFTEEIMAALAGEEDAGTQPTDALATLAPAPQWQLEAALAELKSILSGPSIQARCLDCAPVAPVAARAKDAGFVQAVLGWLAS
ncbi:signal peptide peptidase SppA [Sphingomonas alba]|uniref:Signal peptide peptidase SppA n=1 Tax=Sphingomonas alba TaxID=2908208 RepID=A0ABT0RKZ0_9SPHN|nr:signal peptide peptidase SppA [Sphingomonas alba]MCL6683304.1 signal peptide peptidase SppA [Sphingomonas alba]